MTAELSTAAAGSMMAAAALLLFAAAARLARRPAPALVAAGRPAPSLLARFVIVGALGGLAAVLFGQAAGAALDGVQLGPPWNRLVGPGFIELSNPLDEGNLIQLEFELASTLFRFFAEVVHRETESSDCPFPNSGNGVVFYGGRARNRARAPQGHQRTRQPLSPLSRRAGPGKPRARAASGPEEAYVSPARSEPGPLP